MKKRHTPAANDFALEDGALLRLGARLHLVGQRGNALPLAFALALPYWLVLVLLTLLDGRDPAGIANLDIHVRLLLAIPLMFAFESLFTAQVGRFAGAISGSGLLRPAQEEALRRTFATLRRWRRSAWPELACLTIALLMALLVTTPLVPELQAVAGGRAAPGRMSGLSVVWHVVGITMFRFLLLRCLLLLASWYWVLWRLARMRLELSASHADGACGLAGLDTVHLQFVPLMVASSSVLAASIAADVATQRMALSETFPMLIGLVTIHVLLFVVPLLLVSPSLWDARIRGGSDFSALSEAYARAFEQKWFNTRRDSEPILGGNDFSGFIDLNSLVQSVRAARVFPMSRRTLLMMLAATLVPMMPLLLFRYPAMVLIESLVRRVLGL